MAATDFRRKNLIKIEKVNEKNFQEIPSPCRYCLYWQKTGAFGEEMLKPSMEKEKQKWFSEVAEAFGSCIKIAYYNDVPIGFMQYAPPKYFPRVKEYASGPPSDDAVILACLYVTNKEYRGKGLGKEMLKDLIVELKKGGFKALETFARKGSAENPSGPLELYLKQNFKVKIDKDDFPLLRLEI